MSVLPLLSCCEVPLAVTPGTFCSVTGKLGLLVIRGKGHEIVLFITTAEAAAAIFASFCLVRSNRQTELQVSRDHTCIQVLYTFIVPLNIYIYVYILYS